MPAAVHVLPWLTPTAAAALAVVMVLCRGVPRARPDETRSIVTDLVRGVIAAAVAYGRFVVSPF